MNRKLKKLLNNPQMFIADAAKNRFRKLRPGVASVSARQNLHGIRYSVISAVYGVEQYLEQYFTSMVKQTMDFRNSVELIMVDDGSLDGSAAIIKKWQAKYPNNIRYIKQENGGQAAARNNGIPHARGEWVTFIDPDDFVDQNYFGAVSDFLSMPKAAKVGLLSCNFIFYIENKRQYSDTHPMKFRFAKGDTILPGANLGKHLQLSVNSAFFKRAVLQNAAIRFNPFIRPNFEDAHFVGQYLLATKTADVGFSAKAKYFYRKREDGSSTLDGSWAKPALFTDVLRHGCLDLIERSIERTGSVPQWLQRTVLYHLFWILKRVVAQPLSLAHLTPNQLAEFEQLTYRVFSYISSTTIMEYELAGCWFFHKVGMLGLFRDQAPPFQCVYVEQYDAIKKMVRVRYFYQGAAPSESFLLDGQDTIPAYAKTRVHQFLGKEFASERIVWMPLPAGNKLITVALNAQPARVTFGGKQHPTGIATSIVIAAANVTPPTALAFPPRVRMLRVLSQRPVVAARYRNAWLFMDRDTHADDNAEHLYRYVLREHPTVNAFYLLRRNSPDWKRLKAEGFRLLPFGSLAHKLALLNAEHVVSSHADSYVLSYLPQKWFKDLLRYKVTFLQHGVIQNEMSTWLNTKEIDLFITTTHGEYESIAGEGNRYKFCGREVRLTGMPRHDALRTLAIPTEKLILIMPTWRLSLVGTTTGKGNLRAHNPEFYTSDYARLWKEVLHSTQLKSLADEHGFQIVFFPHANIAPYLEWFEVPAHVGVMKQGESGSMQRMFARASMLVTDYSSVAFEMAMLDKPTVYFQFDRDTAFAGGHTIEKGYFDCRRDGFGPWAFETASVLDAICETALATEIAPMYRERIARTFAYRDERNCERTFDAICALTLADTESDGSAELIRAAEDAFLAEDWPLALHRWQKVASLGDATVPVGTMLTVAAICHAIGRLPLAAQTLAQANHQKIEPNGFGLSVRHRLILTRSYLLLGMVRHAKRMATALRSDCGEHLVLAEYAAAAAAVGKRSRALRLWTQALASAGPDSPPSIHLRLAEVKLALGQVEAAEADIDSYTRRHGSHAEALLVRAEVLVQQNKLSALPPIATKLAAHPARLSASQAVRRRIAAVFLLSKMHREGLAILPATTRGIKAAELATHADVLFASEQWQALSELDPRRFASLSRTEQQRLHYRVALASYRLGRIDQAKVHASALYEAYPDYREAIALLGNICRAKNEWALAGELWQRHLELFPEVNTDQVIANIIMSLDRQGRTEECTEVLFNATKERLLRAVVAKPADMATRLQLLQVMGMPRDIRAVGVSNMPGKQHLSLISTH